MAARIRIGVAEEYLRVYFSQGSKEGIGLLGCIAHNGHRVIRDHGRRTLEIEFKLLLKFVDAEQAAAAKMVERGSADAVDPPRFLAHRDHTGARPFGRSKVN